MKQNQETKLENERDRKQTENGKKNAIRKMGRDKKIENDDE